MAATRSGTGSDSRTRTGHQREREATSRTRRYLARNRWNRCTQRPHRIGQGELFVRPVCTRRYQLHLSFLFPSKKIKRNRVTGNTGVGLHSLHSLHEYSYPVMPDPATSKQPATTPTRRDSLSSLKKNPMTSVNSCSSMATTAPMLPSKGAGRGKKKRRGSSSSSSSTKVSISHLHPPASGKGPTGRIRCKHCQVRRDILFIMLSSNSSILFSLS